MLFAEFAIDPAQVNSLEKLRLLKSSFDFSRGSLISAFPNRWLRSVNEQLTAGLSQMEQHKATSLLSTLKDRAVVKSGREYQGDSWPLAASAANELRPFFSIVGSEMDVPPQHLLTIEHLDQINFEQLGSVDALRQAETLIRPLIPIISTASKIRLVDPYACPSNPNVIAVLNALFSALDGKECEVEIYSEEQKSLAYVRGEFNRLVPRLPAGITLNWFWLNDDGTAQLHQRLFFTEKAGVIFDRGFIVPTPVEQREVTTSLRTMNKAQVDNATRDYNNTQPFARLAFKLSSNDPEFVLRD